MTDRREDRGGKFAQQLIRQPLQQVCVRDSSNEHRRLQPVYVSDLLRRPPKVGQGRPQLG